MLYPFKFPESFLIVLIPAALISGPFLPDLIVVILALFFLFTCFKERNFNEFKSFYFKFFFIFCLYLIFVSILSLNYYSIKSSLFYIRFGIFSLAIYFFIQKNPKILIQLFYLFLSIYFVLFFDSLYQYFFSKNILGFQYINEQNFRVTSFFGDDEVLGSYTARFFPFVLFLILSNVSSSFSKKSIILISLISLMKLLSLNVKKKI